MKPEDMDPLGRALADHLDGAARGPLAIVREIADRAGRDAERLLQEEGGDYLCKLTRRDDADA